MKTTIKNLLIFINAGSHYLENNKGETKLAHAIEKVVKRAHPLIGDYNANLNDIKIDNASVDDRGNLICTRNDKGDIIGYEFTKDGLKALNASAVKLFNELEFEIEPHICKDAPTLDENYQEAFAGFVIEK